MRGKPCRLSEGEIRRLDKALLETELSPGVLQVRFKVTQRVIRERERALGVVSVLVSRSLNTWKRVRREEQASLVSSRRVDVEA